MTLLLNLSIIVSNITLVRSTTSTISKVTREYLHIWSV